MRPESCSGLMYSGVPHKLPSKVRFKSPSSSRADSCARSPRLVAQFGHAPVEHHRLAELADHHVVWFDVAVHDAAAMGIGDGLAQPREMIDQPQTFPEPAAFADCLRQGSTRHDAHRVVERAVRALAEFVHRNDVGVLERASDARLAQKARQGLQSSGARAYCV